MKIQEQIEEALDQVRPFLVRDGGNIEVVDVDVPAGVVRVRFVGACRGCPMSDMTLKIGIETAIMDAVPGITQVIAESCG